MGGRGGPEFSFGEGRDVQVCAETVGSIFLFGAGATVPVAESCEYFTFVCRGVDHT